MCVVPSGDSPDALEEREDDAESWEWERSLFTGLLFSEVEPASKHPAEHRGITIPDLTAGIQKS